MSPPAPSADLTCLGLVARGAQGSVLLVHQRAQGRFLALKIIRLRGGAAEARDRLARQRTFASGEADPWAIGPEASGLGLDAPAGLAALAAEAGAGEGQWLWLLMPYVHGPNALELAMGDARFSWAEVAALGAQVAARLARCPEGQAHGDVKPENMVVAADGRAFLVDREGDFASGTPGYAAPEQRAARAAPAQADVRADLFALGRVCQRLLARAPPKPSDAPDMVPPWPSLPDNASPETRRWSRELIQLLKELTSQKPAERGTAQDAARRFLEIAAGLAGPDLAGTLKASVGRARLPERLDLLAEQMSRAAGERESSFDTPPLAATQDERVSASPRAPRTQDERVSTTPLAPSGQPANPLPRRGRGQGEGEDRRNRIPLYSLAALSILGAAFYAWQLHRPVPSQPDTPPPVAYDPPAPNAASCKVSPPGRLLAPNEHVAPGHALVQESVYAPVRRIEVSVRNGSDVLRMDSPSFGDRCKVEVPPGLYHWYWFFPKEGEEDGDDFTAIPERPFRQTTSRSLEQAPISDTLHRLKFLPDAGPTLVAEGPVQIWIAEWDVAAGTVDIAPHGSLCRGERRPLPDGVMSVGDIEPHRHVLAGWDVCAFPKEDVPWGFTLEIAFRVDENWPPPAIDPAKRFPAKPYVFEHLTGPMVVIPGPAVVEKGEWNLEAGSLKLGPPDCQGNLSDFTYRTAHTIDGPLEIPANMSLCAVPNPDHPGGDFTVKLEGYWN